ncbi:hypothetical protein HMPREF0021_01717 [Acinetobacter baumannii 6013150]|nr:hypothetical protein HMPREF0021_01717 [Acinetobacter baumannii 6013150]EGJ63678.1 hypothetical protein HMPREF0020_02714 [Acinetobacter baumannii 6013113]
MIKVLHLLLKFIDKWIKSPLKLLKIIGNNNDTKTAIQRYF